MTISVANDEAGVLAAAQARVAEIRQAARETYARITGHEGVITLSTAKRAPGGLATGGTGDVNDHPGPDFWTGDAA